MRTALVGSVAFFLLAGAARADGWKDLVGRECPAITVEKWFNTDGQTPTVESLRGKVWILEFSGAS